MTKQFFDCVNCENGEKTGSTYILEIANMGIHKPGNNDAEWGTAALIRCKECSDCVAISHDEIAKFENLKELLK